MFWRSQTVGERRHMIAAFRFELSRVTVPAVRERVVSLLVNDERPDPGLVLDDPDAAQGTATVTSFVAALSRHRHHERELEAPRG